jgi:hypothetical protein
MAIELTISNIFQFFSAITPFLLVFFMVMISIFNQSLKGLIYLAGILLSMGINIFLMNRLQNEKNPNSSPTCNLFASALTNRYNVPDINSLLISFTMAYLILPMYYNKQMNYPIITALGSLFAMDGVTRVMNKCTPVLGVVLGGLFGFMLGAGWFSLLDSAKLKNLLYFSEVISNNVVCSKPSESNFVCSVYKDGALVGNL